MPTNLPQHNNNEGELEQTTRNLNDNKRLFAVCGIVFEYLTPGCTLILPVSGMIASYYTKPFLDKTQCFKTPHSEMFGYATKNTLAAIIGGSAVATIRYLVNQ